MKTAELTSPLPELLAARLRGRVVLMGIGNPMLGDDAAGCLVARGLGGTPGIEVVLSDDVPERDTFRVADMGPDVVVLADAVDMGAEPGSVAVLEPENLASYAPTTHRVPLGLLAGVLKRACGADVVVLALQPRQVTPGAPLDRAVAESVAAVIGAIRVAVARPPADQGVVVC